MVNPLFPFPVAPGTDSNCVNLVGKPALVQGTFGGIFIGIVTAVDISRIWLDLVGYMMDQEIGILASPHLSPFPRSYGIAELDSLNNGLLILRNCLGRTPCEVSQRDDLGMAWHPLDIEELQKMWVEVDETCQ